MTMSRFLSQEAERLAPYTPGEQPTDLQYVKLNTNESPFPPSPRVIKAVTRAELLKLNLYSDPTCAALDGAVAAYYELRPENVLTGNGSDEILAFAFRAFCGQGKPVAFADITYSFYHAQTALFGLEKQIVPLREDFSLNVDDYMDFPGTVVIANYNCPGQLVIGGDRAAVEQAAALARERGARRCLPLKVSGPFHTPLMAPAGAALESHFRTICFQEPQIPVVFNCLGDVREEGMLIQTLLVRQVQSSVYMEDSIRKMTAMDLDALVEIGPGKALSGFVRKTAPGFPVCTVETAEDVEGLADALEELTGGDA